jgi:hypothetical protein
MNSNPLQSFPIQSRRRAIILIGGVFILALVPVLVTTLVAQNLTTFNRIVFFLGILVSIGLAVFAIFFGLQTRLSFTDQGLQYRQPLVLTECDWEKLKGFRIKKNSLFLVFETGRISATYLPPRVFKNPEYEIPLHLFIRNWKSGQDWRTHPVLTALRPHLPEWIKLPK